MGDPAGDEALHLGHHFPVMLRRSAVADCKASGGGGGIADGTDEPVRAYAPFLALADENNSWSRNGVERHDRKWIEAILAHFGKEGIEQG